MECMVNQLPLGSEVRPQGQEKLKHSTGTHSGPVALPGNDLPPSLLLTQAQVTETAVKQRAHTYASITPRPAHAKNSREPSNCSLSVSQPETHYRRPQKGLAEWLSG